MIRKSFSTLAMTALCIMAASAYSQPHVLPDGKRVILQMKDGRAEAFPMSHISDMTVVKIEDAQVRLTSAGADEASISINAEMGTGAKSFMSVCYPVSEMIDDNDLQAYIQANGTPVRTEGGRIEYIDLKPETAYTIAALAFDDYDFPCDITTLTVATTAASGSEEAVSVGGYLYVDGTWSKELKGNKTPIALIFSTELSDKDREAGFTHGYAVALRGIEGTDWTLEADEAESGSLISTAEDKDLKDLDGLTHSDYLMQNSSIHPAAACAAKYGETPNGTSGWYLPSSGQLLAILHNLGGLNDDSYSRQANGAASWSPEAASASLNTLNAKLAKAGEGKYTPFGTYTWTSSEASVMSAYYLYIHPAGGIILQPYYKNSQFDIRPVLAF